MGLWKEISNRMQFFGSRTRFETEMDAEVQFHIETRADELEHAGKSKSAALAQARREFGSNARMREDARAAWQWKWVEDLASDLRYAARACRRNPSFALTAIVCLALGIGANTTIFSVTNEALFSKSSAHDPETLFSLRVGGMSHAPLRNFRFLRDTGIFEGLAGENEEQEANWRDGAATSRLFTVRVTDNFFDVTGIPVLMGRPIQKGDREVALVTYGFWQRRLGGDPAVLGRRLLLDGRAFTISGVLPQDHHTMTGFGISPDLYLPVTDDRTMLTLYARVPAGTSSAPVYGKLHTAALELDRVYPDGKHSWASNLKVGETTAMGRLTSEPQLMPVAAFFVMLMIVVGLVLLIACANVASLLLARASSRTQEMAIRLAIGAGRSRLIRQLLAEALLLSGAGAFVGLGLNLALTAALGRTRLPLPFPIEFHIRPDWRLLGYATLVAVGSSIVAGLMPAIQATRSGVAAALKSDARQVGSNRWTMRNLLVTGQLAVAIVLLCAGFVFLRNLMQASGMNPGFDLDHTLWSFVRVVPERYPTTEKKLAVAQAALDRLRGIPGVDAASLVRVVPLNDSITYGAEVFTDLNPAGIRMDFNVNFVSPDYFRTMSIALLQGRDFQRTDRAGSPGVVILNETMARQLFGETSPLGHTVKSDPGGELTVVGVVKKSKYFTLGEADRPATYRPYEQGGADAVNLNVLVRAAGRPEPLLAPINAVLGQLDGSAAIETKPMRNALAMALLPSQAGALVLGSMGLLGLTLAAIGLYGVLLYAVSRRIREIGLRVALGATPGGILRLVLQQSLALAGSGTVLGLALAVVAVRPLAMFLIPGIQPTDPVNFLVVAAVLGIVAVAATVSPAVRALRVNPVEALRHD